MLALLHILFQFLLVVGKQGMNFAVRFVADSANLRGKLLPRSSGILFEQRLNLIVMLLKQRPNGQASAPPADMIRVRSCSR